MDWVDPLANPGAAGTFGDLFKDKDAGSGTPGSVVPAQAFNDMQTELLNIIAGAGLVPAAGDLQQLAKALPADIGTYTGYGADFAVQDIVVGTFAVVRAARKLVILGEQVAVETAPTDANLIFDVEVNGTSIYTTRPQVADAATAGTAGTLDAGEINIDAGDLIKFKVDQIGSTLPGQGATFTLKAGARN